MDGVRRDVLGPPQSRHNTNCSNSKYKLKLGSFKNSEQGWTIPRFRLHKPRLPYSFGTESYISLKTLHNYIIAVYLCYFTHLTLEIDQVMCVNSIIVHKKLMITFRLLILGILFLLNCLEIWCDLETGCKLYLQLRKYCLASHF